MIDPLNPLHPTVPIKRREQAPGRRDDDTGDYEREESDPDLDPETDDADGKKGGQVDEYAAPTEIQDGGSAIRISAPSPSPPSASLAAHCLTRGMAGSGRPMKNPWA